MTNYINATQTKQQRKNKYNFIKDTGIPTTQARKMRDWTHNHICQFITSNKQLIQQWKKEQTTR